MAKTSTAPSPKANLLRGVYGKVYAQFIRMKGELARARVNPAGAEREVAKTEAALESLLKEQFRRTGLPVVTAAEAAPKGEHWLVSGLDSRRNALYAREPLTLAAAHVDANGLCQIGAIYVPGEDLCVLAEAGLGVSGDGVGRMRVGGRTELKDALAMVPWKTADAVGIMTKLDKAGAHTRKSGNPYHDLVDVALGRADLGVGTRCTRLEVLLGSLMMTESGGFASDLKGKPLTTTSDTMLTGNAKLHGLAVKVLG